MRCKRPNNRLLQSLSGLKRTRLLLVVHQVKSGGNKENCERNRNQQSSHESARQGSIGLASSAQFQSHWHEPNDRCKRSHQNWTQAYPAGFDDRFSYAPSLTAEVVREFDDEDAV